MSTSYELLESFGLTSLMQKQFAQYADLLIEANKNFNLTAIIDKEEVYAYHFYDSLMLAKVLDMHTIKAFADIGAGGGFPSIPLKIVYPHLATHCIEVNLKKAEFLQHIAQTLELQEVNIHTLDWRTFLRTTHEPIPLFVARASLQVDELIRMFQPSSPYRLSKLVYWASDHWKPTAKEKPYIHTIYPYMVHNKARKLVVLQLPAQDGK